MKNKKICSKLAKDAAAAVATANNKCNLLGAQRRYGKKCSSSTFAIKISFLSRYCVLNLIKLSKKFICITIISLVSRVNLAYFLLNCKNKRHMASMKLIKVHNCQVINI